MLVQQTRVGSMGCIFFSGQPVTNFAQAQECDTRRFAGYFKAMLDRGVYLAPSQFECYFVSTAHESQHIDRTIEAAEAAFAEVAAGGDGH